MAADSFKAEANILYPVEPLVDARRNAGFCLMLVKARDYYAAAIVQIGKALVAIP